MLVSHMLLVLVAASSAVGAGPSRAAPCFDPIGGLAGLELYTTAQKRGSHLASRSRVNGPKRRLSRHRTRDARHTDAKNGPLTAVLLANGTVLVKEGGLIGVLNFGLVLVQEGSLTAGWNAE